MIKQLERSSRNSFIALDKTLAFQDYITHCRMHIESHRTDLRNGKIEPSLIIDANSPFELYPSKPLMGKKRLKYGVLLIHGLLDSPFTLKDIGLHLQAKGLLCRAVLLPGHGTTPDELLDVSYHDWIETVRYGVESFQNEVDHVFLLGYSTGATLSIYQALTDPHLITGMVMLCPAIKIKAPVNIVVGWHYLSRGLKGGKWVIREEEIDYTKYQSIPFNAVNQVALLIKLIAKQKTKHALKTPMQMIVSREDETISSKKAIAFFSKYHHPDSKLLLYSSQQKHYQDPRILVRHIHFPHLSVKHFSHAAIPFAPDNPHYGQNGDYLRASHGHDYVFGAYNQIQQDVYNFVVNLGLNRPKWRELSYNPDFTYMVNAIEQFISQPDLV